MKPLNSIANELEKYKPVGMTIIKLKPRWVKPIVQDFKPRLRDEIAALLSFAVLVVSLPFLPEWAIFITGALK